MLFRSPDGIYWPTAFTWFASSVSFWGLPLLMFIFGWVLASVQSRFMFRKDIYSLTLLSQLFIMGVYLPANAQIFQARASLFGIILVVTLYIFTRRKKVKNLE